MSLADELTKLEELRRSGALSELEFARAKAAILNGAVPGSDHSSAQAMSEQLAELRYQNELARLDREWEAERERYLTTTRYGVRQVPSPAMGTATAIIGGIGGILWTVFATALTGSGPDFGPFAVAKVVFPLFGVLFTCAAIGMGLYKRSQALRYLQAHEAYLARRAALRPEGSRRDAFPSPPRTPTDSEASDFR